MYDSASATHIFGASPISTSRPSISQMKKWWEFWGGPNKICEPWMSSLSPSCLMMVFSKITVSITSFLDVADNLEISWRKDRRKLCLFWEFTDTQCLRNIYIHISSYIIHIYIYIYIYILDIYIYRYIYILDIDDWKLQFSPTTASSSNPAPSRFDSRASFSPAAIVPDCTDRIDGWLHHF